VLYLWGDKGGIYTHICLLGLDDGKPFRREALKLEDTLGPHFTLLTKEPSEGNHGAQTRRDNARTQRRRASGMESPAFYRRFVDMERISRGGAEGDEEDGGTRTAEKLKNPSWNSSAAGTRSFP